MAIIVEHVDTRHFYVLVSASYSYFKDSRPSFFGGVLIPHEEEGLFNLVAVTDADGKIEWIPSDELRIVEVDGKTVGELLAPYGGNHPDMEEGSAEEEAEKCPGCGGIVGIEEKICHHCGLTLIMEE